MVLACVASSAQAKLVAKKLPSSIDCVAVPLGITASEHHKGSRKALVKVFSGSQVVYRRKVTVVGKWRKALPLPCGQTYVVVYRFPRGRELKRTVEVRDLQSSKSPTTTETADGPAAADPALTPQEETDEEDAKKEAEDEAHEDDPFPDE